MTGNVAQALQLADILASIERANLQGRYQQEAMRMQGAQQRAGGREQSLMALIPALAPMIGGLFGGGTQVPAPVQTQEDINREIDAQIKAAGLSNPSYQDLINMGGPTYSPIPPAALPPLGGLGGGVLPTGLGADAMGTPQQLSGLANFLRGLV